MAARRALPSPPPGPEPYRFPSIWWKFASETPSTPQGSAIGASFDQDLRARLFDCLAPARSAAPRSAAAWPRHAACGQPSPGPHRASQDRGSPRPFAPRPARPGGSSQPAARAARGQPSPGPGYPDRPRGHPRAATGSTGGASARRDSTRPGLCLRVGTSSTGTREATETSAPIRHTRSATLWSFLSDVVAGAEFS